MARMENQDAAIQQNNEKAIKPKDTKGVVSSGIGLRAEALQASRNKNEPTIIPKPPKLKLCVRTICRKVFW
jgi:hypothetical protein